uniref:Uncharacterized protein n=1 Tax=viral metagenome TaxID=1070528 RepID=A0A6M3KG88_9ZZZZ
MARLEFTNFGYVGPQPSGTFMEGVGIDLTNFRLFGIEDLVRTFHSTLPRLLSARQAKILASIGIDLLARALPRTPYETGELRESGLVSMTIGNQWLDIATGNKDGTVTANLSKISVPRHVRNINLEVSFYRISRDGGLDIAQWVHEMLLPYDSRPSKPAARQPRTGPKFLEIPFNEKINDYYNLIADKSNLERDIAGLSRVRKRKKGPFDVDLVTLVESRIDSLGYYG